MLISKLDLLPHVEFDVEVFRSAVRAVQPAVQVHEISATKGAGMTTWYSWLRATAGALATRSPMVTQS